jgi:predicted ATP-grasp superfamily ATP-dependent carboligase
VTATPVLVTDAPSNATLAVVRSLGRRGIPVGVCGFADEFNLSSYSRWASESFILPSPSRDARGFIDALARLLASGKYPIVFPTTERTIQLIGAARAVLPEWVRLPIPDAPALATVVDKERTIALARHVDVRVPQSWCPDSAEAAAALAGDLDYPVIVKPRQTNFLGDDGRLAKTDYVVVRSANALLSAWQTVHAAVPRPLVQTLVRGRGVGVNTLWNDGQPVVWFSHRRVREIDLRGGRSTAAATVACDPGLLDAASRMLAALRWHGVAMVEFKWDDETGTSWLLEINGRFWGSLPLALAAGVDFPYYLYQIANDEKLTLPGSYPVGLMARDAVAEMKHFVRVMAHGGGARLATLRQAPTILHPWKAAFNWVPDDPEPGRREWVAAVKRAFTRGRAA